MSNCGRSGGSMAAGFSIESEQDPEDKCRRVIIEHVFLEITTFASDACLIILKM